LEITLQNKEVLSVDKASELELEQLNISLTKRIENWKFHPSVQKGFWNGYISYFKNNKWIPAGLWHEIVQICREHGFDLNINYISSLFDKNINFKDFEQWAYNYFNGHSITPRDYQVSTAFNVLQFRRCLAELATSSGKTLVAYLIIAYLLEKQKVSKVLMIVPKISLVVQASEDFFEYNWKNQTNIKIQQIYSGQKIQEGRNVVIGTYQSLTKKSKEYFNQFDAVFVDETHQAKSNSIKTILQKCKNADYRFGMSGTIPKKGTLERLTLMAYTGPSIANVSTSYLQERGDVAQCEVKVIQMDYAPESAKKAFFDMAHDRYDAKEVYGFEQNYIINSPGRLKFIRDVVNKVNGNSLVLFHRIEHGRKLYEELRYGSNRPVYYVDGQTDKNIREEYKQKMENGEDVILVASYGTFSTGISIKKMHNIFFTESFKSEIIIRQSIGRGLRQHESKSKVKIIDFVDDFSYDDWQNHLLRHGKARQNIYKEQKFKYDVKKVSFQGDI
jgi:superfamily II DNA or RNA helicase